ncbi:cupin, partial [Acinetobacter baumannii]|nr:cupin [Acinetobacter baumannii]
FRMPNISGMIDRISDQFATDELLQNPVIDIDRKSISQVGEINTEELAYLRGLVLAQLQNSSVLDAAIMAYMTEPKYPDNIPEPDEIEV